MQECSRCHLLLQKLFFKGHYYQWGGGGGGGGGGDSPFVWSNTPGAWPDKGSPIGSLSLTAARAGTSNIVHFDRGHTTVTTMCEKLSFGCLEFLEGLRD